LNTWGETIETTYEQAPGDGVLTDVAGRLARTARGQIHNFGANPGPSQQLCRI